MYSEVFEVFLISINIFFFLCFQESSTWVEKDLSFTSPGDQHSPNTTSGDEEEEGGGAGRKRLPTSSSDDDDDTGISERRRKPLIISEKRTENGSSDLGGCGSLVWLSIT